MGSIIPLDSTNAGPDGPSGPHPARSAPKAGDARPGSGGSISEPVGYLIGVSIRALRDSFPRYHPRNRRSSRRADPSSSAGKGLRTPADEPPAPPGRLMVQTDSPLRRVYPIP